jgi:hypothetical protein
MADGKGTLTERVATLEEAQRRTNGWQKEQDATLVRVDGKLDSLRDLIEEKFDSLRKEEHSQKNQWVTWVIVLLIGLPGTAYAAVNLMRAVATKSP